MNRPVLAVIETLKDRPLPGFAELLGFCETAAADGGDEVIVIVPGRDVSLAACELAERYGFRVIRVEHEALFLSHPLALAEALADTVRDLDPRLVALLHTTGGPVCASMIAARAGMECITGVESFRGGDGGVFTRSVFNGKLRAAVRAGARGTVVTVMPGSFASPGCAQREAGPVESRPAAALTPGVRCTGLAEAETDGPDLAEAEVIVAAGRGIGDEKNIELVRETARMFAGGAVGASRPVVDRGWLPYSAQVGVTGKTVNPGLYFACGISGAQQHLVGMKGSRCVIAVNRDPGAAIFSAADYIVVEDVTRFLPVLLAKHRERTGREG